MKLTNLWYYYFTGAAGNRASAEFSFDADASGRVVRAVEDSRSWFKRRYHATARPNGALALAASAASAVSTSCVARPGGAAARGDGGRIAGKGDATAKAIGHLRVASAGLAAAMAGSSAAPHAVRRIERLINAPTIAAAGSSLAQAAGAIARARGGKAAAAIGPDLVEQELEELLFILEVAA